MSRQVRKLSQTGLYHVIFRGISRQNIFEEKQDYEKLLKVMKKVKEETNSEIYAYCLMSNHVHLFIKEKNTGDISKIMSKILTHYALWYNIKYLRSGALFGERYKSEPVEDERYFLGLVRYIHQNPKKAEMVETLGNYEWSSYGEYIGKSDRKVADVEFCLNIFSENKNKAAQQFIEFNNIIDFEQYEISNKKSSEHIRRLIMREIDGQEPHNIKSMSKDKRNMIIKKLVIETGISKSALERATGISRGTISRIINT